MVAATGKKKAILNSSKSIDYVYTVHQQTDKIVKKILNPDVFFSIFLFSLLFYSLFFKLFINIFLTQTKEYWQSALSMYLYYSALFYFNLSQFMSIS